MPRILIGDDTPRHIFLGGQPVKKIYVGSDLVWEAGVPPDILALIADVNTISLDDRPSGNIKLDFVTANSNTNLLHAGNRNVPVLGYLEADPSRDIDTGLSGATFYGITSKEDNLYVTMGTTAHARNVKGNLASNINLGVAVGSTPSGWRGGVYADSTFWFINIGTVANVAFAFNTSGAHIAAKNIVLGAGGYERAFTNGTTLWFIDNSVNVAKAWTTAGVRDSSKDFNLGSGNWLGASIADKATYVLEANLVPPALHAYTTQDRQRRSSKDFVLPGQQAGEALRVYRGLGYADDRLWVLDVPTSGNAFLRAYTFNETRYARFIRYIQQDFDIGSGDWQGAATNGVTAWILDDTTNIARAWNVTTRQRDSAKDINLGARLWRGIIYAKGRLYGIDSSSVARAYSTTTYTAVPTFNITHGNTDMTGGFSVDDDIWFINDRTDTAVSFSLTTGTPSNKNLTLGRGQWDGGSFTTTNKFYILNRNAVPPLVRGYRKDNIARDPGIDFTIPQTIGDTLIAYRGAFAAGNNVWFIDSRSGKAIAYYVDSDFSEVIIPQPTETTEYTVNAIGESGSAHRSVTVGVTQQPALSNLTATGRGGQQAAPQGVTIRLTGRVQGWPRPTLTVDQNWRLPISDRHFSRVAGALNTWSFDITQFYGSSGRRTFNITATNTSGSATSNITFNG